MFAVVGVEAELENSHAREVEGPAQRGHILGNDAEVFGYERKPTQGGAHGVEERQAGAGLPYALFRGLGFGGNRPIACKPAKVVEAQLVVEDEAVPQALDPPGVSGLAHPIPAVEGIPPELPGRAEVVGGNAGDACRCAVRVEVEEVLVRPHVGRVERGVDGNVAQDRDTAIARLRAKLAPARHEHVLGAAMP